MPAFEPHYLDEHTHPNGAGDARPTALQIIKDEDRLNNMTGKVVFITGGSQGIGIETVRAMHATGADVYFTVRSPSAGDKVLADIKSTSSGTGALQYFITHLDDLSSVKSTATTFLQQHSKLHILINNAGIMATPFEKTKDGYESQLQVNFISHFLLFHLLQPALAAASTGSPDFASRVVNVTSIGHRTGSFRFDDYNFAEPDSYTPWSSYGQSKTALIWMTNYIDRVFGQGPAPIRSWSLHPGGIWSNLQQHVPKETVEGWKTNEEVMKTIKSTAQGASTTVLAAVGRDLEGKGGLYLADCRVMDKVDGEGLFAKTDGWAEWAYEPESEERLWKMWAEKLAL